MSFFKLVPGFYYIFSDRVKASLAPIKARRVIAEIVFIMVIRFVFIFII